MRVYGSGAMPWGKPELSFSFEKCDTEQLREIISIHLRKAMEKFAAKNREYRGETAPSLGAKGEFVEINRKIGKLRTAIWDDHPELLTSETVEEVLEDLIGHCLLALYELGKS